METKLSVKDVENILIIALDNTVPANWSKASVKAINALMKEKIISEFNGSRFDFGTSPLAKQAEDLFYKMV